MICSPALRMQEERVLHEAKLAKMEAEMKMVFSQKVQEKEAKLKQSEEELYARHREMKEALEKQKKDLETKKMKVESGRPLTPDKPVRHSWSCDRYSQMLMRYFLEGHQEGIPSHVMFAGTFTFKSLSLTVLLALHGQVTLLVPPSCPWYRTLSTFVRGASLPRPFSFHSDIRTLPTLVCHGYPGVVRRSLQYDYLCFALVCVSYGSLNRRIALDDKYDTSALRHPILFWPRSVSLREPQPVHTPLPLSHG